MKIALIIIMALHGIIHLLGFVKAFRPAMVSQLTKDIPRPAGILWLLASLVFSLAAVMVVYDYPEWWAAALPAILLSQALIIHRWSDARFGTAANVIILLVALQSLITWRFEGMVSAEAADFTAAPATGEVLESGTTAALPPAVRKWLERSGVMGKPVPSSVHLLQTGEMRTAPNGKWMPVTAEQWFTTAEPGFLWSAAIKAMPGFHISGRDRYRDGKGSMLIKALSFITVADVSGKEIDQGAMLRYLAETAWFPWAAARPYIKWKQVDDTSALATITWGGITASGTFTFTKEGDVAGFRARRYYYREGESTLEWWQVRMDPQGYRDFGGVRVPAKAEVSWDLKGGEFTWFKLTIDGIEYMDGTR